MITIPRSDEPKKDTWQLGSVSGSVLLRCPKCGRIGMLMDHEILEDGTVIPSVQCPNWKCDFHDFVQLLEWNNGTI